MLLLIGGCSSHKRLSEQSASLSEARNGFKTTLLAQKVGAEPVEKAPPAVFRTLTYPATSGELAAYLTPDPGDGKKHPAIVWITGGDCNSIGDMWSPSPRDNDQTAAAYRKAGIIMMFPSLRGGNDNPGVKEGFLGEVDDVLAATDFLQKQTYVDPKRIYLGGHSTGGTLTMLIAECSSRYRAVFSFGPVSDVRYYGPNSGFLPIDITDKNEVELRSPGYWLSSIKSPVWVLEGTEESNVDSLRSMSTASTNPNVHFIEIKGATHFSTLAPTNELIAKMILHDTEEASGPSLSSEDVNDKFAR